MENSREETIRAGGIISSGMDQGTQRAGGIISSGMDQGTQQAADLIQAGVDVSKGTISSGAQTILPQVGSDIFLNGERYSLIKQLGASGEAEVFLAENKGQKFALKLYHAKPGNEPKEEILQKLKGLNHPDIVALVDYGWVGNRFCEVMEYAEGGTLADILPIRSPQRLKQIVAEVVEALQFCHTRGIIHRDLKPHNIFFRDAQRTDVVIGDFGISTALVEGYSAKLTTEAWTFLYTAPETLMRGKGGKTVVSKAADYYALGMTLIHAWTGEEPFKGLSEYVVMRAKAEGKVPIPEDLPREFQTLLKGLLTLNPDKRWGYEEVQRWLRGESVPVYYEERITEYPVFVFGVVQGRQLEASDPATLADLMEAHPDLGMRHLYRKAISRWVQPVNQYLFTMIESIVEEEYPRDQQAGLIKAIYLLDPQRPFRGVDGGSYGTPDEIAECLEQHFDHYEQELQNPTAPLYLFLEARGYKEEADRFRELFKNTKPPKAALNALILFLQSADAGPVLRLGEFVATEPRDILVAERSIQERVARDLADPYSKVSLWLQQFPHLRDSVNRYRALRQYEPEQLRYAFKEGFLLKGKVVRDSEELKAFLRAYPEILEPDELPTLNEWLKNYLDTSLNCILLDLAAEPGLSEEGFLRLSTCALRNDSDKDLHVFAVIDRLLDLMAQRSGEHG
jgi:hypothetical protein